MSSLKPQGVAILLAWCLFMGVTAISIGVGAIFPALNTIAGPFICSNGQMSVDSATYYPQPGTTVTTMDWMCVDNKTGEARPINELSMFLINGVFYGLILFAVIIVGRQVLAKRRASQVTTPAYEVNTFHPHHSTYVSTSQAAPLRSATSIDVPEAEELRKIMSLRDEGLITEEDYEQKKAEILRRM